jgi:hypothetical protein
LLPRREIWRCLDVQLRGHLPRRGHSELVFPVAASWWRATEPRRPAGGAAVPHELLFSCFISLQISFPWATSTRQMCLPVELCREGFAGGSSQQILCGEEPAHGAAVSGSDLKMTISLSAGLVRVDVECSLVQWIRSYRDQGHVWLLCTAWSATLDNKSWILIVFLIARFFCGFHRTDHFIHGSELVGEKLTDMWPCECHVEKCVLLGNQQPNTLFFFLSIYPCLDRQKSIFWQFSHIFLDGF